MPYACWDTAPRETSGHAPGRAGSADRGACGGPSTEKSGFIYLVPDARSRGQAGGAHRQPGSSRSRIALTLLDLTAAPGTAMPVPRPRRAGQTAGVTAWRVAATTPAPR